MQFTWGDLLPNGMTCKSCGATWEPYMSYDVEWVFTSAPLVKLGKERKGSSFLNRDVFGRFLEGNVRSKPGGER
jgi:hypothetical protein